MAACTQDGHGDVLACPYSTKDSELRRIGYRPVHVHHVCTYTPNTQIYKQLRRELKRLHGTVKDLEGLEIQIRQQRDHDTYFWKGRKALENEKNKQNPPEAVRSCLKQSKHVHTETTAECGAAVTCRREPGLS